MNESLLELYIANKTAPKDTLEQLKRAGQLMQIALRNQKTNELNETQLYLQKPTNFGNQSAHHQVMELFNYHLPLVLYGMSLCPSPKTRFFNQMEPLTANNSITQKLRTKLQYNELTNTLFALSTSRTGKFDVVAIDNERTWMLIPLTIERFDSNLLKDVVTINPNKVVTNRLNLSTYRYFDNPTADRTKQTQLNLEQACRIEPSKLANWLFMPSSFYGTQSGLEIVALQAFRYGSKASSYDEFLSEAKQNLQKVLLHPVFNRAKGLIKNVQALNNYISDNRDMLELAIHNEIMAMKSTQRTINISHYYKGWTNIAFTSYGWMRSSVFEWSNYADLSFHSDFNNALFQSLLPEIKADSISKNPIDRVNNATSLISNFNVREVPTLNVYGARFKTPDQLKKIEEQWEKSRFNPSSRNCHTTTIDDKPFFNGYFEGIPSIDQERYVNYMTKLMQVDRGAKLSGAQYKLPVTLSKENGQMHLKRQSGNLPFTHIAKMPQPDLEVVTLSEWLALTLLRDAGLNVAKNQLVAYSNQHEEFMTNSEVNLEQQFSDIGSIEEGEFELFKELGMAFESSLERTKQAKLAKVPPFLISERFDIPYDTEFSDIRITSIDLGAIANTMPEDKYTPSFEKVAESLKDSIPSDQFDEIASNIYDQIIASIITHNNDLHVKNITILAKEDLGTGVLRYEVSPIYDVLITPMVFSNLDEFSLYSQALSINGTKCPCKEEVIDFGVSSLGLSRDNATKAWGDLETRIGNAARNLKNNLPHEIVNNLLWKDSVESGLLMVQRNIKHLQDHGKPYGHYVEQHHLNTTPISRIGGF